MVQGEGGGRGGGGVLAPVADDSGVGIKDSEARNVLRKLIESLIAAEYGSLLLVIEHLVLITPEDVTLCAGSLSVMRGGRQRQGVQYRSWHTPS